MSANGILQVLLYLSVLFVLVKPLGLYMARIYQGEPAGLNRLGTSFEQSLYRLCGVDAAKDMRWTEYALAMLLFNLLGVLAVYALQRLQGMLPLNPQALAAISPDSSFNTSTSFATNTNWQGYAGESTMSYFTQMLGLAVQNFFSAATGMAIVMALIRSFARRSADGVGNFWVDMTRTTLYILLPLSFLLAIALVSQGVIQNFHAYNTVSFIEPVHYAQTQEKNATVTTQTLPMGPVASQEAIKELGTNGGGFFNANSAHPYENPTPLSNFLEMLAIFLIPAALCYAFGKMIGDTRQGWAILAAMTILFIGFLSVAEYAEIKGNPLLASLGVDETASTQQAGGNMEGKETRFGIVNSVLFATITTAASCGAVNAMHDSFTPLGGLVPLWLIQLGEVVFGGVGSGLYGMLMFAIVAVFIAGLMIGRTPEYLGKKIESFEVKMAALTLLIPPLIILVFTALAVLLDSGRAGVFNPGPHGLSEVLYAFSSGAGNNGSAFAGLSANTPFYNLMIGLAMLFGRFWLAVPVLAIAGSLAAKKLVPVGLGTLPTHTPLFVVLLIGTVLMVGALNFIPALALGPVVEQLQMLGGK